MLPMDHNARRGAGEIARALATKAANLKRVNDCGRPHAVHHPDAEAFNVVHSNGVVYRVTVSRFA